MDKIKIVIHRRINKPEISIIENNLNTFETIVGGNIEVSHLFGDICVIYNESIGFDNLTRGDFIIAAIDSKSNIKSLSDNQIQYVLNTLSFSIKKNISIMN